MQVGFINEWYDRFYLYMTITNSKYTFSLAKENFKAIEIVQRCLLVQVIIIHKHDYYTLLALEGASRPSSKYIVNMFSLCTS